MTSEALDARIRQAISRALTHWRLFNLSLAGKCRVLFGLAVLLIIAVAVSILWYRMERLVEQRISQEAHHLADEFIMLQVHSKYFDFGPRHFSLDAARQYPKPTLIKLTGKPATQPVGRDKFVERAIRVFGGDPTRQQAFQIERDNAGRKIYRYVRAVRASQSCLECHQQAVPGEQYQRGQ